MEQQILYGFVHVTGFVFMIFSNVTVSESHWYDRLSLVEFEGVGHGTTPNTKMYPLPTVFILSLYQYAINLAVRGKSWFERLKLKHSQYPTHDYCLCTSTKRFRTDASLTESQYKTDHGWNGRLHTTTYAHGFETWLTIKLDSSCDRYPFRYDALQ